MTEKIKEQILAVRDSGAVNMLLTNEVQRIAFDSGFHELVMYIEEHKKEYARFIMTGESEWNDGEERP